MIDMETKQPVRVHTEGDAGAYLMVPLEQLEDVTQLLSRHRVRFTVAEDAIALDGHPVVAIVDFGRGVDATYVQELLDQAA